MSAGEQGLGGAPVTRRLTRAVMALAVLVALIATPASTAGSRHGYDYCRLRRVTFRARLAYVDVTAADVLAGTPDYRDCTLGRMAAWHIGVYRYDLEWKGVETRLRSVLRAMPLC